MKKRIIIFGASGYGKRALNMLDDEKYEVIAFVDNNSAIWNKEVYGIKVDKPENIVDYEFDLVIIASSDYEDVMTKQLEGYGVQKDKIEVYARDEKQLFFRDTRISTLRSCIEEIIDKKLEGNMAEVGVYRGDFAKYMNRYLPEKKLYLFDTFEGFSEKDGLLEERKMSSFKDTKIDIVLNKMSAKENCIVKKGYFPDTAFDVEDKFCLVSLDADLYNPILSGLEFFYPRLVKGGYIFVHDYGNYEWDGVKKAVREFSEKYGVSYVPLLDRFSSIIITKSK